MMIGNFASLFVFLLSLSLAAMDPSTEKTTELINLIMRGQNEGMTEILKNPLLDLEKVSGTNSWTALRYALFFNRSLMAKQLIEAGAVIHDAEECLIDAVKREKVDIVRLLLENGVNPGAIRVADPSGFLKGGMLLAAYALFNCKNEDIPHMLAKESHQARHIGNKALLQARISHEALARTRVVSPGKIRPKAEPVVLNPPDLAVKQSEYLDRFSQLENKIRKHLSRILKKSIREGEFSELIISSDDCLLWKFNESKEFDNYREDIFKTLLNTATQLEASYISSMNNTMQIITNDKAITINMLNNHMGALSLDINKYFNSIKASEEPPQPKTENEHVRADNHVEEPFKRTFFKKSNSRIVPVREKAPICTARNDKNARQKTKVCPPQKNTPQKTKKDRPVKAQPPTAQSNRPELPQEKSRLNMWDNHAYQLSTPVMVQVPEDYPLGYSEKKSKPSSGIDLNRNITNHNNIDLSIFSTYFEIIESARNHKYLENLFAHGISAMNFRGAMKHKATKELLYYEIQSIRDIFQTIPKQELSADNAHLNKIALYRSFTENYNQYGNQNNEIRILEIAALMKIIEEHQDQLSSAEYAQSLKAIFYLIGEHFARLLNTNIYTIHDARPSEFIKLLFQHKLLRNGIKHGCDNVRKSAQAIFVIGENSAESSTNILEDFITLLNTFSIDELVKDLTVLFSASEM